LAVILVAAIVLALWVLWEIMINYRKTRELRQKELDADLRELRNLISVLNRSRGILTGLSVAIEVDFIKGRVKRGDVRLRGYRFTFRTPTVARIAGELLEPLRRSPN
jgi:hypothetical protein